MAIQTKITTAQSDSSAFPLTSVAPDDYPRLNREGLGALKLHWRKSNVDDDWSKGGHLSSAWDRITGFPYVKKPTYDVDFAMRVLAKIAQEIPAWREIVSDSAFKLTSRMTQYAGWNDWVEEPGRDPNRGEYSYLTYRNMIPPGFAGIYNSPGYCGNGLKSRLDQIGASAGLETWKPVAQHPYFPSVSHAVGRQYNPDPVYGNGSSNMMYKGFFAHSLMLGYLMSGESRFTDPQHLVYDNDIQYWYSVTDMVRIMCEQFLQDVDENGSSMAPGIDCEVGKAFPLCISVGGMACQLHDLALGTDYMRGYDKWVEWAKQNVAGGASSPDSGFSWCAPYVDRDIPYVMSEPRQQAGSWFAGTALHMLPRAPHFASRLYEGMMENFGRQNDDGIYVMFPPAAVGVDGLVDRWATALTVAYAAEIGDVERAEGLKNWMAKNAGVSYDNGEFCFTFNHDEEWPRGLPNAVATLGYIGGAGSWRRMYSEANFDKFRQPTVYGVDYPAVNVTQATYDASRDALVFSIAPGTAKVGSLTTFRVKNYPLGGTEHQVLMDGQTHDDWTAGAPGEIIVRTTVADHTFVIR